MFLISVWKVYESLEGKITCKHLAHKTHDRLLSKAGLQNNFFRWRQCIYKWWGTNKTLARSSQREKATKLIMRVVCVLKAGSRDHMCGQTPVISAFEKWKCESEHWNCPCLNNFMSLKLVWAVWDRLKKILKVEGHRIFFLQKDLLIGIKSLSNKQNWCFPE